MNAPRKAFTASEAGFFERRAQERIDDWLRHVPTAALANQIDAAMDRCNLADALVLAREADRRAAWIQMGARKAGSESKGVRR